MSRRGGWTEWLLDVFLDAADRIGSADFDWAVMAMRIQAEVGGNLSELLDQVADTMRERTRFKAEVIDPAYNSLFALQGEGFLQDNIKYIGAVPAMILDAGVAYKSLREEVALIETLANRLMGTRPA